MTAYYNEIDPRAAAWLRELIKGGHIAAGDVDETDIRDVDPSRLGRYTQCHFFAGIGGWSHALRLAGWPDDRPVWTGSCPCQPFSAAGRRAGQADERHLWPHWHHLISVCRPPVVFGEQVASKDGLGWLDLVSTDMEGSGYAVGAADLCAAGVGAPHIRQRLWFVGLADASSLGRGEVWIGDHGGHDGRQFDADVEDGGLADAEGGRHGEHERDRGAVRGSGNGHENQEPKIGRPASSAWHRSEDGGLADAKSVGECTNQTGRDCGERFVVAGAKSGRDRRDDGDDGGLADADDTGSQGHGRPVGQHVSSGRAAEGRHGAEGGDDVRPSPTDGHWRDADWLFCRDGKWRPVEPGTFPLAHGVSARVGRLRGYGNAIVPQVAATFIRSVME